MAQNTNYSPTTQLYFVNDNVWVQKSDAPVAQHMASYVLLISHFLCWG